MMYKYTLNDSITKALEMGKFYSLKDVFTKAVFTGYSQVDYTDRFYGIANFKDENKEYQVNIIDHTNRDNWPAFKEIN